MAKTEKRTVLINGKPRRNLCHCKSKEAANSRTFSQVLRPQVFVSRETISEYKMPLYSTFSKISNNLL
jgi:hypothetical protein